MELAESLGATGTVCVVGAGGKKTTLYALANHLDRAVVTATVRIPIFDSRVSRVTVTDDPLAIVENATEWPMGVVPEREGDRYRGYEVETIDELGERTDVPLLVKADGARTRELKAPGEREPQLPRSADTVIPVASAHVVGEPLDERTVHRPERVAALTGLAIGDAVTSDTVATVLASPEGGLRDVPEDARAVPLINKVDDADDERVAREIARGVHERADVDRVVLARMADAEVVDVI
ncbi:selenium cofactor biosynthesis protein YqeC [Halalkalicoccus ordinarius]|uniref:selenium cofactor biosynthesis protein YqeC n=1 Tax=Halalkalicoccus ordinarius TaxID=3116651 RepID=UPI00300EAC70